MDTVLVVQTRDEPDQQLLRTAKRHVTGTETEAIFCRIVDEKKLQNNLQRQANSERQIESIDEMEEIAKTEADDIASDAFGDDIPYRAMGLVGTIPDDIIEVAKEEDCGHIFISGKKRSPAGKAVFGDVAQSVILQFDGPVTVTTMST
ncbi:universal stress protein [Haloterrigena sp. SYSU A121-1]|uniref:Universal stress protein n=1 Tax=Haloterrigena gelatinilytica TaxID=2741724 RepID=A0A8J8GNU9_9EURY|nr:universal stress protein [Haloterrigena gelatinilytica]NUB93578.1 universal stress protein [Haloterrigena gelatinilytica]